VEKSISILIQDYSNDSIIAFFVFGDTHSGNLPSQPDCISPRGYQIIQIKGRKQGKKPVFLIVVDIFC
jgi:hypothetical protein